MGWIIAGAVILFILLLLILIPKAAKPFIKTQASWGKGFSRIYFLLAFLYAFLMALLETDYLAPAGKDPTLFGHIFVFIIIFVPLILIFYVLRWVFRGFKK